MLAQERQNEIINILVQRGGIVKMTEFAHTFSVSNETIRRDLEMLQDQGLVQRVYGGAMLLPQQNNHSARAIYSAKKYAGQQEREAIGKAMASMIEEHESLLLSTGTTVLEVAKCLKNHKHLTILTNSILVIQELADTNFDIYVLGGKLSNDELDTSGEMGLQALKSVYVDRAIIGAGGITLDYGISDFNNSDFLLREEMLRRTNQVCVVCQSSKFGRNAFCIRTPLEQIDMIVTDQHLEQEYIDGIQERDIKLVLAEN